MKTTIGLQSNSWKIFKNQRIATNNRGIRYKCAENVGIVAVKKGGADVFL
jgi:hypothetical protein